MSEPAQRGPITLGELASGVRDDFLQWDRGLVGTFIAMCWRPARVPRALIYDRDDRYTSPWRYLLFAVLASITGSWLVLDVLDYRTRLGLESQMQQASFLMDNAALLTLITLPIIALAMRLCFLGLKVRYIDAIIVLFYTQGQANLFGLIALAVLAITGSTVANLPVTVAVMFYLIWAWASFATGPWWRRIIAAVLTLVGGQIINSLIVLGALRLLAIT